MLSRAHSPGLLPEIIRCFESAVAFSRNSTQEQGGKLKKRLTYTPSASIRDDETDPVLISSVSALATLCQQKLDVTAYTEYWKLCRKVHVLVLVCLRRGSPSTVVKSASLLQEVLDRFQAAVCLLLLPFASRYPDHLQGKEHPSCNAELFPVVCEMCRDVTIVLERRDTLLPADSCDETGKVIWQYISRPCIEVVMGHGGEWSASHYCIWTQAAYALSSDMVNSGTRWSYTHQLLMSNDEDQVVASVNMLPLAVASSLQSQTIPSYFGPRDCLKQLLERLWYVIAPTRRHDCCSQKKQRHPEQGYIAGSGRYRQNVRSAGMCWFGKVYHRATARLHGGTDPNQMPLLRGKLDSSVGP